LEISTTIVSSTKKKTYLGWSDGISLRLVSVHEVSSSIANLDGIIKKVQQKKDPSKQNSMCNIQS